MKFIVYDKSGKILSTGHCQKSTLSKQAGEGEFVLEGIANDVTQRVVDGEVVDKTTAEIEKDSPKTKVKPFQDKLANITNKQWQSVLDRLVEVERQTL